MTNSISQSFSADKLPLTDAGRTGFPAIRNGTRTRVGAGPSVPPAGLHPQADLIDTGHRRGRTYPDAGGHPGRPVPEGMGRVCLPPLPAPTALVWTCCVLALFTFGPIVARGFGNTCSFPKSAAATVARSHQLREEELPDFQKLSAYKRLIL